MPIFFAENPGARLRALGSGVLLRLKEEVFLLTVAHVTDEMDRGSLLIPGREEIVPIDGFRSHVPLPVGSTRAADKIDIAYLRLSEQSRLDVHSDFEPLEWNNLGIFDTLCEGDLYTFAGFPASRSKTRSGIVRGELFKYSGGAASNSLYADLDYDPSQQIAIAFNRKRSMVGDQLQTAPHPRGISGGGIFAWPKSVRFGPSDQQPRRLVGIGHTFHEAPGCLVGTRINGYVAAIAANHPALLPPPPGQPEGVPMVSGLIWYRAEDWEQLKADFEDSESMHSSWHEWREVAQHTVEKVRLKGVELLPVELSADEITQYCTKAGLPNISRTRIGLVNRTLRDLVLESPTSS